MFFGLINKSKVVQQCLYSFRQRYSSSQWWKCCALHKSTTIFSTKGSVLEHDQNHETKKEQGLSITFTQYDWFISLNEGSCLAITLRDKLMRAWREHCWIDSYWQWQISQSDCEIKSNCGKKLFSCFSRVSIFIGSWWLLLMLGSELLIL